MDIGYKYEYPAKALSNLFSHTFTLDGVVCASMEGFLQSLKFRSERARRRICSLSGLGAKRRGACRNYFWQRVQLLWWQGKAYGRFGQEYQDLLDRAYQALASNPNFRDALLATKDEPLTHSNGRHAGSETVLTEEEFCSRLMVIRAQLQGPR